MVVGGGTDAALQGVDILIGVHEDFSPQRMLAAGALGGVFTSLGTAQGIHAFSARLGLYRVENGRYAVGFLSLIHISEPTRPY